MSDVNPDPGFDEASVAEGESDIPWKPPVIAAILGALVVGIYVIYAIVTGPSVESEAANDLASATAADLGYVAVTNDIGARAESVMVTPTVTIVAVSTAVRGGVDPSDIDPLDVAYWELATPSGTIPMQDQYRLVDPKGIGTGAISVTFPPNSATAGGELVAFDTAAFVTAERVLELSPDLPQTVEDVRLDIGDGVVVVVESITFDEDGGYVEWTVAEGLTARVDVVVRFVGTGESGAGDTLLVPAYSAPSLLYPDRTGVPSTPFGFRSQYRLGRTSAQPDAARSPTAIIIEFTVEAVTAVADPVAFPLDR